MSGFLPPRVRRAFRLAVRRPARTAGEVDEELAFHVEQRVAQLVARGWSARDAEAEARRRFGMPWDDVVRQLHHEGHHREERLAMRERLGSLLYDVRHALRALARDRRYTLGVVLTLALGLGAATTIVSLVDQVLVRPLPYAAPERLVVVRGVVREMRDAYPSIAVNAFAYRALREGCTRCAGMAALKRSHATLQGDGDPQRLGAARVTANLFDVLGVKPLLGRDFTEAEDDARGAGVVLVSHRFWVRQLGADPSAVGRTIRLSDFPQQVVGVLPPEGEIPGGDALGAMVGLPAQVDVFFPFVPTETELNPTGMYDLAVVARLAPGATLEAARAELDGIVAGLGPAPGPGEPPAVQALVLPLHEVIVGDAGRPLLLLLAAVATVLLIVCSNLSGLALVRDAGRRREAAVRVALGASRGRLTRLALAESLALSLAGGALGLLLAWWGLRVLVAMAPATLPRVADVGLDGRAFAIAAAIAALVGVAIGVLPALRRGAAAPGEALRASSRSTTGGRAAARRRAAFIGGQVALGTVLLVAAGLFVASLVRVLGVDRGFDTERVLALDVTLPYSRYDSARKVADFNDRALRELAAVPGARSVALTNGLPLEGETWVDGIAREEDARDESRRVSANIRFVSPGYLATAGTRLERGRDLARTDEGAARVVVVSARAARALWPGEDPIGKRMDAGPGDALAEVVGVAADVHARELEDDATVVVYLPAWESPQWSTTFVLRAAGDPAALAPAARAALRRVDAAVPVPRIRTSAEILSAATAARRFQVALLAVLALMAFVTASVGIYGVISQSLAGRAGEIGVRMALGAEPRDVQRLVLREGMLPVLGGLLVGSGCAIALGTAIASQLFEVSPADPATLATVAALLGGVGVVACLVPARRAARRGLLDLLRFE